MSTLEASTITSQPDETIESNATENETSETEISETEPEATPEITEEVSAPDSESEEEETEEETTEEEEFSPAQLFAEDFVVTSLLATGRPLRGTEINERAADWKLPRLGLREALAKSQRVVLDDRTWDCRWRIERQKLSREERSRTPIEALIRSLLLAVGKPLPAPVIAREVGLMLNSFDPNLKNSVAHVLKTLRFALEISPNVYLHEDFVLKTGAPSEEFMIKENRLDSDPDFQGLIEFAEVTSSDADAIARELMEFTGGALTQKVIGFFVYRANPKAFSPAQLAGVLNDREKFQPLVGGFVTLQDQLGDLKAQTTEYLQELGGAEAPVDAAELLRQRVAPKDVVVPTEREIEEARHIARLHGGTIDLAQLVSEVYEIDVDDQRTIPTLQGLNDALRRHPEWLPMGIGRFLLRDNLPEGVGQIPDELRPVTLEVINPENKEPFDFELEDEGLEGNSAEFVHDPLWEDVGEENEAKSTGPASDTSTKIVVLNHHVRAGTVKLRKQDEAVLNFNGPLVKTTIFDREDDETIEVWLSRETGLIYGLEQWCAENLPPSGGTLRIERTEDVLFLNVEPPHAQTFLTERRIEEIEELRERGNYQSLFELLTEMMSNHPNGIELEALWAQVNVVRRTSKRLLTSVLSGYSCFSLQQRGPSKFVWVYDSEHSAEIKKAKRRFIQS